MSSILSRCRFCVDLLKLKKKLISRNYIVTRRIRYFFGDSNKDIKIATSPKYIIKENVRNVQGIGFPAAGFSNYDEGINDFKMENPEYFNFCHDVIDKWAALEEEEIANGMEVAGSLKHLGFWWVAENGQEFKWTFTELSTISKRFAYVLTNPCGLERGDRVMLMMSSYPQYWFFYLGLMRAGIVICPCSHYHPSADIKSHLINSQAKCIITDHNVIHKVDEIADECPDLKIKVFVPRNRSIHTELGWFNYADLYQTSNELLCECENTRSDETMIIFFTSGVTGKPKLVEHTHGSYGALSLLNGKYWYDQTREDIIWTMSDSGWSKVAWSMFGAWHQGACVFAYLFDEPYIFTTECLEPSQILTILEDFPITTMTSSPPLWKKVVQEDLASCSQHKLRHAFSSGELLPPEVMEKFEAGMGCKLYDGYGQTENSVLCANFKCLPEKEGSIGKPAPGYCIAIIDDEGNELPVGSYGHIAIKVKPERPLPLFKKYLNDPSETARSYIGDYYITGDIAMKDEDGYFWYGCRKQDIMYTSGHKVSPFDVERALMEYTGVAECAVVSCPDHLQLTGQMIKAYIVLSEDYREEDEGYIRSEIHKHCINLLESYQIPQKFEFVLKLPCTVTGKVKRSLLREKEWHYHDD